MQCINQKFSIPHTGFYNLSIYATCQEKSSRKISLKYTSHVKVEIKLSSKTNTIRPKKKLQKAKIQFSKKEKILGGC